MKNLVLRGLSIIGLGLFAAAFLYVYHLPGGLIALAIIAAVTGLLAFVLPSGVFNFLVRRIILGLITLWVIASFIFLLFFISGQDPARTVAGRAATPQLLNNIRKELGLNKPLPVQYVDYLNKVVHGNLGRSYVNGGLPVIDKITRDVPKDISLAVGAAVIWITVGLAVGILAARHPRTAVDRGATVFVLGCISMPTFILGLIFVYIFMYLLPLAGIRLFPPYGTYIDFTTNPIEWAHALILPWITLAMITAATYSRLSRSSLLETLGEDYIRTARAKGLSERRVVYRHAMRSAMTPIVTQFGIDVAAILGGAIVTETVFSIPGLGLELVQALTRFQDLPTIQGVALVASAFIVVANIVVDASYALLDPRVRVS